MGYRKRPKRHFVSGHVRNGQWVSAHFRGEKWERVTLGYIVLLSVFWSALLRFVAGKDAPISPFLLPFAVLMVGIYVLSKLYNPAAHYIWQYRNRVSLPAQYHLLLRENGFKCKAKSDSRGHYESFSVGAPSISLNGNVLNFPNTRNVFIVSDGIYFLENHISYKICNRKIPFSQTSGLFRFHLSRSANWKDEYMSCTIEFFLFARRGNEKLREATSIKLEDQASYKALLEFFRSHSIPISWEVARGRMAEGTLESFSFNQVESPDLAESLFHIPIRGSESVKLHELMTVLSEQKQSPSPLSANIDYKF